MSFYTSINRYKGSILYRGYNESGHRIEKKIKFKPTLFLRTDEPSEWLTLFGDKVKPVEFATMGKAKEFIEQYKDVDNLDIFGTTNYIHQYITKRFPNKIDFERSMVDVMSLDIEVLSKDGFPFPEIARWPITAITTKSSKSGSYHVWGIGDFDPEKSKLKDHTIRYHRCNSEEELLLDFLKFFSDNIPDVITGWNVLLFDMTYVVNRIGKLLGSEAVRRLSPWGLINERTKTVNAKQSQYFDIIGIQIIDFMDAFKKFDTKYGPQENYKLDHIAQVVLGDKKLKVNGVDNTSLLLASAECVKINKDADTNVLSDFEKKCILRDKIRHELATRDK